MESKIKKAKNQENEFNKYCNQNNKGFEEFSAYLYETINSFIKIVKNSDIIPTKNALEYNLGKLYKSTGTDNLNNHITMFLKEKLLPCYSLINLQNHKKLQYIYVVQRNDGMVCVVGRSHFKININYDNNSGYFKIETGTDKSEIGDLFHDISPSKKTSINNLTGTPKLIFELTKEEMGIVENNDIDDAVFKEIKNDMRNYYRQAFVIPIQGDSDLANSFERMLGEYLLLKKINILNEDSHLN